MSDIRKRTGKKGQTWQVRYNDSHSGQVRYKTFPRRKDADAFLSEISRADYIHDTDTVNFSKAADRWLHVCKTIGRKGREPIEGSTARKYEEHTRIIKSVIGDSKLNTLTPVNCDQFRDELLMTYSRKYAKKILTSFKSILSQARTDGYLRHDPAENTAILISQRHEKQESAPIPSIEEIRALLNKASELANCGNKQMRKAWSRYAPFFFVLTYSGMRPCEVIGLPWKNVSFVNNTIEVTQDSTETGEIGLPKSASAYRTIHMPVVAMTALKKWQTECPKGNLDLVFPNWKGGVESHANITNRGWYVLQRACGFIGEDGRPIYPLKSFRHVRASLEIHNGATAKEVQLLMGHSTVKITFDVYGATCKTQRIAKLIRFNG